jgi:hypothetical protein
MLSYKSLLLLVEENDGDAGRIRFQGIITADVRMSVNKPWQGFDR